MGKEDFTDLNKINASFNKTKTNSDWKESVMTWECSRLSKFIELKEEHQNGNYKPDRLNRFIINERGHTRLVKAVSVKDRITLHTLCDMELNPLIEKKISYDNGASRKGKGIGHTRRRLSVHLNKYYKSNGNSWKGYILLMDFSKFYDNILHSEVRKILRGLTDDEYVLSLCDKFIDMFLVDVSDRDEETIQRMTYGIMNLLKDEGVNPCTKGERFIEKSMGIGSQLSQSVGLIYPNEVDHLIKTVKGHKYSGRYNDDSYIIDSSKTKLLETFEKVKEKCQKLGIHINLKKTCIRPLEKGFTFLKTKYIFEDNGKIVKIPAKDGFQRQKRVLKKKFSDGMNLIKIYYEYKSWRKEKLKKFNCYHRILRMDSYYNNLLNNYMNGA